MRNEEVEVRDAVTLWECVGVCVCVCVCVCVELAMRQHGEIGWWPEKHKGFKDF